MSKEDTFAALENAIGQVCQAWSLIESHVGILLENKVWAALHVQLTPNTQKIIQIFSQNMDVRQKIQTAKAIAVGFRPPLFKRVERLLNQIDNDLRPKRNRYIHDVWIDDGEGFIRIQPGSFVERVQAHSPVARMGKREHYTDINAVRTFHTELCTALKELMALCGELEDLRASTLLAIDARQAGEG